MILSLRSIHRNGWRMGLSCFTLKSENVQRQNATRNLILAPKVLNLTQASNLLNLSLSFSTCVLNVFLSKYPQSAEDIGGLPLLWAAKEGTLLKLSQHFQRPLKYPDCSARMIASTFLYYYLQWR